MFHCHTRVQEMADVFVTDVCKDFFHVDGHHHKAK